MDTQLLRGEPDGLLCHGFRGGASLDAYIKLAGQYIIEEVLGQDGVGITYRATEKLQAFRQALSGEGAPVS